MTRRCQTRGAAGEELAGGGLPRERRADVGTAAAGAEGASARALGTSASVEPGSGAGVVMR